MNTTIRQKVSKETENLTVKPPRSNRHMQNNSPHNNRMHTLSGAHGIFSKIDHMSVHKMSQ